MRGRFVISNKNGCILCAEPHEFHVVHYWATPNADEPYRIFTDDEDAKCTMQARGYSYKDGYKILHIKGDFGNYEIY